MVVERVIRNKRQGRKVQSVLAKRVGGKNVGTIEGQDISHPVFSIEAKHRKQFIGNTFMEQAIRNAPKGKIPIVIVHTLRQRFSKSLVLIRMSDWEDWCGTLINKKEG